MAKVFEKRVDYLLESGFWQLRTKEPIHFIVDKKSWPEYDTMDISTGLGKKKKKTKRIAGKL